jgi:NAD(P)H dehydrogenase (quinone)
MDMAVFGLKRLAKYYANGAFKGKKALLSLATGAPEDAYFPGCFNGDINGTLRSIHRGILEFVGFTILAPTIAWSPAHVSEQERAAMLTQYENRLRSIENEESIAIETYSSDFVWRQARSRPPAGVPSRKIA